MNRINWRQIIETFETAFKIFLYLLTEKIMFTIYLDLKADIRCFSNSDTSILYIVFIKKNGLAESTK